jgi:predicted alpha/beta hydrolase
MDSPYLSVEYPDQHHNRLRVFAPTAGDAHQVYIILPALGVRASFYRILGDGLAARGQYAVSVDWRGHGESSLRAQRGVNYGYATLIQDIRLAVETIKTHYPSLTPILLGHSLGGQLGSLVIARYPELVHRINIVAACSVHYTGWDGLGAWRVRLLGATFFRIANLLGYFPGDRIGFGGREFPRVMQDWGHNALTGRYEPLYDDFDYEQALQEVAAEVKAYTIAGDDYAPPRAMRNLLNKYGPQSIVAYKHLTPDNTGAKLDHFSWARESEAVIDLLLNW